MLKDQIVPLSFLITASLTASLIYLYKRTRKRYETVGYVSKLTIYPIKSCRGITVPRLTVAKSGVRYELFRDRGWVVVSSENRMLNLIRAPKLITITIKLNGDSLELFAPDGQSCLCKVRTELSSSDVLIQTNVYGGDTEGIDCGDEVAEFISGVIEISGCRLIQYVEGLKTRPSRSEGKRDKKKEAAHQVTYQNYSDVHLTTESSLEELNQRIMNNNNGGESNTVTSGHFRPNIEVSGSSPWEEDTWEFVQIGDGVELYQMQNCNRCPQTVVNRDNGVPEQEPLFTLRQFRQASHPDDKRRLGTKPLFGSLFATISEGSICTGDDVLAHRVDRI
ncbi:Mitochondrial amidoxime-reducing component 1 [Halotydeus destructor]|nr:Mitochondrial amidoxime-reducing component 1 [Halotydeus destructor]